MNKAHENIGWENKPSERTPLNAHNLDKMDNSIDVIDDRVLELDEKKANLHSPTFTGTPHAPTAVAGTVSGQLATTRFASNVVNNHNDSQSAHDNVVSKVETLTARLNALADSDDETLDQLSEIVAYIKSNRGLIESITTSKVSVSDIVDNLTSSATNKPLSAKQGKILNDLIASLAGSVPSIRELTQAQYDALTGAEKMNGTIYFIKDAN